MPVLTIRQHTRTDSGFTATLTIAGPDGTSQYEITLKDPFDLRQEQELEFYFEEWIRFPFDQQVIAARAAKSVETLGTVCSSRYLRTQMPAVSINWLVEVD